MKIFGAALGNSQHRAAPSKSHVERSKLKGSPDNIVLIDVESDNVPNIIIIDVPDSLEQKLRGSKVCKGNTKFPLRSVISIEDDGSSGDEYGKSGKNSNADACSSRKSRPSKLFRNIMDSIGDDCEFSHESPFNLCKCKRMYSEKSPSRNRYDSYHDLDGNLSDSDCSDCEITLREQWENASLKRKFGVQSGLEDRADVSGSHATHKQYPEAHIDSRYNNANYGEDPLSFVGTSSWNFDSADLNPVTEEAQFAFREPAGLDKAETCTEGQTEVSGSYATHKQYPEAHIDSSYNNANYDEDPLSFMGSSSWNFDSADLNPVMEEAQFAFREPAGLDKAETCTEGQTDVSGSQNATHKQYPEAPVGSSCNNANYEEEAKFSYRDPADLDKAETCTESPFFGSSGGRTFEPVFDDRTGFCDVKEKKSQLSFSTQEHDCMTTFSQDKRSKFPEEPCLYNSCPDPGVHVDFSKDVQVEETSSSERQHSVKTKLDPEMFSGDKDELWNQAHLGSIFSSIDQSRHEDSIFWKKFSFPSKQSDGTQFHHDISSSDKNIETMLEKTDCCQNSSLSNSDVKNSNPEFQEKVKFTDETRVKQGISSMKEVEEPVLTVVCNNQAQDRLCSQDVGGTHAIPSCIINERERLKETAEYKKAIEEEWASRKRQLQIQAEEAQRLRKKRRAESMRLLDMERRQKLRVQEIRETQKKDEEHMNLKEQLRVEVRNRLNKLEMTCKDMASLLRCLGVDVRGGRYPSSNEVHAAYKRALLSFHPDRSSRSEIQKQVEAEEKFKLISRMKDKLIHSTG